MAGIGILVDDGNTTEYTYKILAPTGSSSGGVLDLSNPSGGPISTFMDTFNLAKGNADSISNTYGAGGELQAQEVIEDAQVIYSITYNYTLGSLSSKVISKTSSGSVTINYVYSAGVLIEINQIGGN